MPGGRDHAQARSGAPEYRLDLVPTGLPRWQMLRAEG
jgi:hypothetical protein